MASEDSHPYDFARQIPTGGFLLIEDRAKIKRRSGRWLIASLAGPIRTTRRDIHPKLFLEFGKLEGHESEILAFANREGALVTNESKSLFHLVDSIEERLRVYGKRKVQPGDNGRFDLMTQGESIDRWQEEICDMRNALSLWQAINAKKIKKLKTWLTTNDSNLTANYGDPPRTPESLQEGDYIPQTMVSYVGDCEVGHRTTHDINLDWNDTAFGSWSELGRSTLRSIAAEKIRSSTFFGVIHKDKEVFPAVTVHSLLGRIWLQFLDSIASGRLRVCTFCRTLFYAAGRNDQWLCSRACRQRSYEKGKTESKKKGVKRGKKTSKR